MKRLFFLFLLAIPLVSALDCSQTIHQDWCNDIQNSAISEEEKAYLLSDIFSDTKHYPDHQLVKSWNELVPTDVKPDSVAFQNSGPIKNAWMKILAIMPSVKYNDTLYIDTSGEVLSGFGYEVQLSSARAPGDCRTTRTLLEDTGTISVYANGVKQGEGNNVPFIANLQDKTRISLKAVYDIAVRSKVRHYTRQKRCFEDYCWYQCSFSKNEYQTDHLSLEESIPAVVHHPELTAAFNLKDQYQETAVGEFSFSDGVVNTELLFADASLKHHNYLFSEQPSLSPLNILTIYAEKKAVQEEENLVFTDAQVVVANTQGCRITVSSFFQEKNMGCNLDFEGSSFTAKTDKVVYHEGESITLHLSPEGVYKVSYAGKSYATTDSVSFPAEASNSEITIQHKNRINNVYVHVKNDEPLNASFALGIFGTVNYVISGLIRKYWGFAV